METTIANSLDFFVPPWIPVLGSEALSRLDCVAQYSRWGNSKWIHGEQGSSFCCLQVLTHASTCISSHPSKASSFLSECWPAASTDCHRRSFKNSWSLNFPPGDMVPWVSPGEPRRSAKLSPAKLAKLNAQLLQSTKSYVIFFPQQKNKMHSMGEVHHPLQIQHEKQRSIFIGMLRKKTDKVHILQYIYFPFQRSCHHW